MRTSAIAPVLVAACGNGGGPGPSARRAPIEPAAITWDAPLVIARGGGDKGPWRQNESPYDYVDDPTVVLAPDGAAHVAWVDQRGKDIWFQVFAPDGAARLAAAVNLSGTPAVFSWLPRLARSTAAPRDVYALWQEIVFSGGTHGGEIFFARSTDDGATWSAPANLSRSINGDGKGRVDARRWDNGSLDLAVAGDGALYAAWTEYDGPLWLARSTDRGAAWTAPVLVDAGAPHPARAPALAVSRDTVYLAWTVGETTTADVRLARSTDAGASFASPVIVAQTAGYSDAPALAIDPHGTLHVVFGEHPDVRYTRSRDGGARFEPPRTISRAGSAAGFPALGLDGDHVYVAWERYADDTPRGLELTRSLDRGDRFAPPALVPGSLDAGRNGSQQGQLTRKLAVRAGAVAVVNSALRAGADSRVWLVRGVSRSQPADR
jgi:hypothetical protein